MTTKKPAARPPKHPSKPRPRKSEADPVRPTSAPEGAGDKPGTERARDQHREGGPRVAGGPWERAGDATPESKRPISADEEVTALGEDDMIVDEDIEGGGQRRGMGRDAADNREP